VSKRQKQYLGCIAVFALISLVALFVLLSWPANYNYCVSHSGAHNSGQYNQYGIAIFAPGIDDPSAVHLFTHFFWVFTDQHAGAPSAASTILLTFITFGLVVLGWMQFSTTRAQLRAYVGIETAGIYDTMPL
jgi:hypothetical protein